MNIYSSNVDSGRAGELIRGVYLYIQVLPNYFFKQMSCNIPQLTL